MNVCMLRILGSKREQPIDLEYARIVAHAERRAHLQEFEKTSAKRDEQSYFFLLLNPKSQESYGPTSIMGPGGLALALVTVFSPA